MEKKRYYSVWISKDLIWEGIASTSYEAIDRACAKHVHLETPIVRSELLAKVKK